MSFDVAEVFTVAVRHVVPLARSRGLSFAFDCQTEGLMVNGEPAAAQGGLHRIFVELLELVHSGSWSFRQKRSTVSLSEVACSSGWRRQRTRSGRDQRVMGAVAIGRFQAIDDAVTFEELHVKTLPRFVCRGQRKPDCAYGNDTQGDHV